MKKELNNILYINTGGGLGDALNSLTTINHINSNFLVKKIYYFSTDLQNFWYENKLKEFKPKNLITIKNFPIHFGFERKHLKLSKNLINLFEFNKFDLILDNQTRILNTLIYKKIPHDYFISPCLNFLLSKPFYFTKKNKNIDTRLINYINKIIKKDIKPNYHIEIPKDFLDLAQQLMPKDKKYVGFSITAGHPSRKKEFEIDEIIKVANHYGKKFVPTFFIENKYSDIKKILKKKINNIYFPEEMLNDQYKKPMIVTALGKLTEFNISIDNGISHMLFFSNNKNYIFYNENSQKFKPITESTFIYDCKLNNKEINDLKAEEIIDFINQN